VGRCRTAPISIVNSHRAGFGISFHVHEYEREPTPARRYDRGILEGVQDETIDESVLYAPGLVFLDTGNQSQTGAALVANLGYATQHLSEIWIAEGGRDAQRRWGSYADGIHFSAAEQPTFWIRSAIAEFRGRGQNALTQYLAD
jgi:hypothetical protein